MRAGSSIPVLTTNNTGLLTVNAAGGGDDTLVAARHAARQGWIAPQELDEIVRASAADQGMAAPPEQAPTVVVAEERDVKAGAVESVLQASQDEDRPPSVIVEGEKKER